MGCDCPNCGGSDPNSFVPANVAAATAAVAAVMGPLTGVRCFILFSIEMAAAITQLNTCLGNATTQAERDACWLAFEAYIFTRTGALLVCLKRELSNPLP